MAKHWLTASKVRGLLRDGTAPGRYGDGDGLHLHVAGGQRSWVLRVVIQGRRRDLAIGRAREITLADARAKAAEWRQIARTGGDPTAPPPPAMPSFMQLARELHAVLAPTFRNAVHRRQWLSSLEIYVAPKIGDESVDGIDTPAVLTVLAPIWTEKPETARRVRQRIEAVLAYATAQRHRPRGFVNPASIDEVAPALPRHPRQARHHAALPWPDVPTVLRQLQDASRSAPEVRLALEFTVLTGARTGETLGATWAEMDLATRVWTVPASRMKAGRPHRVPLAARAIAVLEAAKQIAPPEQPAERVFRARGKAGLSNMALLMALRRLGAPTTTHGFRSTLRDWAAARGVPNELGEAMLAHQDRDATRAAYLRTDHLDARVAIMAAWADHCTGASARVVHPRREVA